MPEGILFLWLLKVIGYWPIKSGPMNYNRDKLKLAFILSIELEGGTRS